MMRMGYDYAHGTGHGVGINVHESGARISSTSQVPMAEGQVVSIEPGIYIPGVGGVRLENICIVEKHPKFKGFLRFFSANKTACKATATGSAKAASLILRFLGIS